MEECSTHLVKTFPELFKNWSISVFWRAPSPKTHTTGSSRHDRLRQLTLSVSFVEESIGGGRLTSNVTLTPTFRKQQLSRKGLSQSVQNHNQHRVTRIEPVFWQYSPVEQITYVSRYTRSRSNAPSAPLAKCTRFGCVWDWGDKQRWLAGEAPSATARFYSNGRNSYSFLVPCERKTSKMTSCSSYSLFALVPFNTFDLVSKSSRTFVQTFWNCLVLLVRFGET
jgi:hypothetical protein